MQKGKASGKPLHLPIQPPFVDLPCRRPSRLAGTCGKGGMREKRRGKEGGQGGNLQNHKLARSQGQHWE